MNRALGYLMAGVGLLAAAGCGEGAFGGACAAGCGDGMICDTASGSCVPTNTVPVDQSAVGQGLPCDVQSVVVTHCAECHGATPASGASDTLTSRAALLAQSSAYPGETMGQRSLARMQLTASPMPPAYKTQLSATEVSTFSAWVNGGMPEGSCTAQGIPDAGPPTPVCTTNSFWTFGTAGSASMEPGMACRNCHRTQQPSRMYPAMGTVFGTLHEKDTCNGRPPADVRIEILNSAGAVTATIVPKVGSGNFWSTTALPNPYTARVTRGTSVVTMTTPQTNGDCNVCHTVMGTQGAPGRIVWPQ